MAKTKIPKEKSPGEEQFVLDCRIAGLSPFLRQYKFHPTRKWLFDFARPECKLAIEVEGGVFSSGGHVRGKGYESNCEKYNAAVKLGWRVLRYSTDMVFAEDAINDVLEILAK